MSQRKFSDVEVIQRTNPLTHTALTRVDDIHATTPHACRPAAACWSATAPAAVLPGSPLPRHRAVSCCCLSRSPLLALSYARKQAFSRTCSVSTAAFPPRHRCCCLPRFPTAAPPRRLCHCRLHSPGPLLARRRFSTCMLTSRCSTCARRQSRTIAAGASSLRTRWVAARSRMF